MVLVTEKTPWQKYKEKNGVTFFDLLNPASQKSDSILSKARLEICESCDKLISTTKQCKECGCIMPLKVRLASAKCPLSKW